MYWVLVLVVITVGVYLCIGRDPCSLGVEYVYQLLNIVLQWQYVLKHNTLAKQGVEVEMHEGGTYLQSINIQGEDIELSQQSLGVFQPDMSCMGLLSHRPANIPVMPWSIMHRIITEDTTNLDSEAVDSSSSWVGSPPVIIDAP